MTPIYHCTLEGNQLTLRITDGRGTRRHVAIEDKGVFTLIDEHGDRLTLEPLTRAKVRLLHEASHGQPAAPPPLHPLQEAALLLHEALKLR
jgi:hypothetical protein